MYLKIFMATVIVFIGLVLWFVFFDGKEPYPYTENVLTNGMKIAAHTPIEKLTIEGMKGTKRRFSGEGWTKIANLTPRPTRWYGSLGLYDPADSYTQSGRLLVDEGRQFFDSKEEALRYLCEEGNLYKIIYTNSGLVIGQDLEPTGLSEPIRDIIIWQIYIKNKKPVSLKGADDQAIQITGGTIPETATPHPAKVGYPRKICNDSEFKKSPFYNNK